MAGPLPEELAKTLARKLRDDQLVLFAGAGLSMQAVARDGSGVRMPGWGDLLDRVAARFKLDRADYTIDDLDLLDDAVLKEGRPAVDEVVAEIIGDDAYEPGAAHAALRDLPWAAVCTTNFDTLLERSMGCAATATEDDFKAQSALPPAQRGKLFKLHGPLEKPHTLTADDYRLWAEAHPLAYRAVENLLINRTFLFVGYSLKDPHWRALIDLVRHIVGKNEKRLYALIFRATDQQLAAQKRTRQIEGASLADDAAYVAAFRQIQEAHDALVPAAPARAVDPVGFAYDRAQYAQAMRRTYGHADLGAIYQWGAGFARDDVSLSDIFVPPDLLLPAPATRRPVEPDTAEDELSDLERERRRHAERPEAEQAQRKPAQEVAAAHDRLLIVGAPGQGKSTLLRHWLLAAIDRWLLDPVGAPFPCLIRLSQWKETEGPPEGRLRRYLTATLPVLGEVGREAAASWHEGNVLWLLDGIDEIRGERDREIFREELIRLSAPGSRHRFIVTTRPRPAGEPRGGLGAEWLRVALPVLSEPQVLRILRNWSLVLEAKDGRRLDAADFSARLGRNPGLRQVRGNALLLTMAVLFFKQRKRLPNDRWEFYNSAEEALRDSWARHRLNDRDAERLPGDYAATVLETLALDGMKTGRVLFTTEEVNAAVRAVLAQRDYTGRDRDIEARLFVDAARDAIGVLVEQAPDRFGFVHLTLQEFLAARALVKRGEDAPGVIERFWDHPDWRETWVHYALGCQGLQGRFGELFDLILNRVKRHRLDTTLQRPERVALRLAGLGTDSLPDTAAGAQVWAERALKGRSAHATLVVLNILAAWERLLPDRLRDGVIARISDSNWEIQEAAVQALAASADDDVVTATLLGVSKDRSSYARGAAVQALATRAGDNTVRAALLGACKDGDWYLWDSAVQALAAWSDDETVRTALVGACTHKHWGVPEAAVKALASRVDDEVVRVALLGAFKYADMSSKISVIWALAARKGDETVRAALFDACKDNVSDVRTAAAKALATWTDDDTVRAALLAAYNDQDWRLRQAAVQALTAWAADKTVRNALLEVCNDNDPDVLRSAIEALAAWADDETVRTTLLAVCNYDYRPVRLSAVNALSTQMDDPVVRTTLLGACKDDADSIRQTAVAALSAWVDDATVRETLLNVFNDQDWFVRILAIDSMKGQAGDQAVRGSLLRACNDENWQVRLTAIRALADWVDDAQLRTALFGNCKPDEWYVRVSMMRPFPGLVDDATVFDAALGACKVEDPYIRRSAIETLTAWSDNERVRFILVGACKDNDNQVRQAAVQALENWIVRQKFPRGVGVAG